LAGSASTYLIEYAYGWASPETDYEAKVLGQADRAIALAPRTPHPLELLGESELVGNDRPLE
jgi:hypothetical protein